MGSPTPPPPPAAPPPPARGPRPGAPGETASAQRQARLRSVSRLGQRASIIAGETGGFNATNVTRPGSSLLG